MGSRRLVTLGLTALMVLCGWPAIADVPDVKTDRLREYQLRRFELTLPASNSYLIKQGPGTQSVQVSDHVLVEMAKDDLLKEKLDDATFWRGVWQLVGSVGGPIGAWVFFDNFLGNPRPDALASGVPAPVLSFYPGNDWRSYGLAALGAALGFWGFGNLGSWVAERFDWAHPNLLAPDEAKQAALKANQNLANELALSAADVASASEVLAMEEATQSAAGATALKGVEGSAAFYLKTAGDKLRGERGEGYRLYLVFTRELTDATGKLTKGAWHYLFYHPQRLETLEVEVPVFGASPRVVGPASAVYDRWKTVPELAARWSVDSPQALSDLSAEFSKRGIAWLADEYVLLLVPNYGTYPNPLWLVESEHTPSGAGLMPCGVDAASASVVDLVQAGLSLQPIR